MWAREAPGAAGADRGIAAVTASTRASLAAWDDCRWEAGRALEAVGLRA